MRASVADGSFTDQSFAININDVDEFDATARLTAIVNGEQCKRERGRRHRGRHHGFSSRCGLRRTTRSPIRWTIATEGGSRSIRATGVVTVAGAIDREADGPTRSITVRSTSSDGSSTVQSFVINIDDVDEFDMTATVDVDGAVNSSQ